MPSPARDPYRHVKRALRQEVGFQCPVAGCGNPYLTWHHFDPPWRIEHHHRPEGMIALCAEHANKADHGAFTDSQLMALKAKTPERQTVSGRFDWRRQDFLVRLGGNFYHRVDPIFQLGDIPCAWLNRDEDGLLEVNFRMPTRSDQPRASVIENFWEAPLTADEVISPPMGRLIEVKYTNGDYFKIHFKSIEEPEHLLGLYPQANVSDIRHVVDFPTTLVEISNTVAGTNLQFAPDHSRIGMGYMRECLAAEGGVGLHVDISPEELSLLLSDPVRDIAP